MFYHRQPTWILIPVQYMFSVLQPVNSRTCYFKTMLVPASSNYVRTEQQIIMQLQLNSLKNELLWFILVLFTSVFVCRSLPGCPSLPFRINVHFRFLKHWLVEMKRKRDLKKYFTSYCIVVYHSSLNLFQTGIVFLGVFAPALGRNFLVRGDGSSFSCGRDLEQHNHARRDRQACHSGVALPLRRIHPPSSIGGPNLFCYCVGKTKKRKRIV
jgi:hypothetical protein